MASIHFIVNPLRPSIGLRWPYEEQKIRALTQDFEVHITRGHLHAETLTRVAIENGAKLIVCAGGDSTLSEVVNALSRSTRLGERSPKLSLYPELQQGDFIRSLELKKSFLDFLEAYLNGTAIEEKMDVGEVRYAGDYGQQIRRFFVNCAGFGFSSVIVGKLSKDFRISRTKFNFFKALMRQLPFYRHPALDIFIDGQKVASKEEFLTGLIHNGRFGAYGLQLSSASNISDGLLDYTLISRAFTYQYLLGVFPLFSGKLRNASFVKQGPCREIRIQPASAHRKVRIDFDGDLWGFLPAEFRVVEKAIHLLR